MYKSDLQVDFGSEVSLVDKVHGVVGGRMAAIAMLDYLALSGVRDSSIGTTCARLCISMTVQSYTPPCIGD